ncbi:MAG: SDR family oxidoreductase [Proteobacteria bacterium]|nr:SDR family oxidoreductase [Pseudomonadota bacterium]
MSNNQTLKGQKALVTGASSGIGQGIAEALAAAGAAVIINYIGDPSPANAVVNNIEKKGGIALAISADVSQENQVKDMFQRMRNQFGTIDILVNNAGIQKDSAFLEMTLAEWNAVLQVNLTGYFLCAREASREFIRRGVNTNISRAAGKIICISSVHQVIPWSRHCNYATSKGGIMMFMKTLAQELSPHRIRVNGIAPGAIKTNINREAWDTSEAATELLKLIPYGRIGEPEDIAKAAIWLASDDSDYVQGATLFVDGGMCLFPGFATGG